MSASVDSSRALSLFPSQSMMVPATKEEEQVEVAQKEDSDKVFLCMRTSYGHLHKLDLDELCNKYKNSFLLDDGTPPEFPGRMNNWPSLSDVYFRRGSTTVVLDKVIYVLGGVLETPKLVLSHDVLYLDTQHSEDGWKAAASMNHLPAPYPNAVALRGKIYLFQDSIETAEVFDPVLNRWDPLPGGGPPEQLMECVSPPVLSDPLNGRIIVHFSSGSIYSYELDADVDKKWRCLVPFFPHYWIEPCAVLDNVLYLHPEESNTLSAFDLVRQDWLTTVWSPKFECDIGYLEWDALIHLGNGRFSMGTCYPILSRSGKVVIQMITFTVEKRSSDSVVVFSDGSCYSFVADGNQFYGGFFLM